MKSEEQVNFWVQGESVHNYERDECCPDFSCCSAVRTPMEERMKFKLADEKERRSMLMVFLGRMLAIELPKADVEII